VFDPGPAGIPVIARPDQCQTCYMCELYCPADALYVGADQRAPETPDPAVIRASGLLGRLKRDHGWDQNGGETPDLAEYWRLGPLLMEGAEIAARRYAVRFPGEAVGKAGGVP
jgi:ferredoxin